MTCDRCGAHADAEASFCANCGSALAEAGDERRIVTVLFADIVGFTRLAEGMDPERVKSVVDDTLASLAADVREFGGRVDKIVGDGLLALFGAPVAHEDDAERAVRSGLRMQQTIQQRSKAASSPIEIRVGINTGEVLVGALRAGGDYTAMGDVVNTAQRLQEAAVPGQVVVGTDTQSACDDAIEFTSLGSIPLKGRAVSVDAYTAMRPTRLPGHRHRSQGPLIGRQGELELLRGLVSSSIHQERAQFLLVLGEAGVGKTRLTDELEPAMRESRPATTVLHGRCVPYGEANPYWPIAEIVREAAGLELEHSAQAAGAAANKLVRLSITDDDRRERVVNALVHLLGHVSTLRGLDPVNARSEASEGVLSLLEAVSIGQPVLVRLSDLQWASDEVLELIDALSERLTRRPVVLAATSRVDVLDRWTPKVGRHNLAVLNLDVLDDEARAELLDSLVAEPLEGTVRADLLDRSGGNPLFIEELAVAARRSNQSSAGGALPTTLRGLVAARIDELSPQQQATLEDAAVWGPRGSLAALEELGRHIRGTEVARSAVESLANEEILSFADGNWEFRSNIFAEVAYDRITKSDRLERHFGIAIYLESLADGYVLDDSFVDTVGRHYYEAAKLAIERDGRHDAEAEKMVDAAWKWVMQSAERAERSAFWDLAIRLYDRAATLLDDQSEPQARLDTILPLARSLGEAWRFDEAQRYAQEAAELAEFLEDTTALARSCQVSGQLLGRVGNIAQSSALLDESIELFTSANDLAGVAESFRIKGMTALIRGDNAAAEGPIAASLDAFVKLADRRGEAWALMNLGWIAFSSGRISEAEGRIDAATSVFSELGDGVGLSWTSGLLAFLRFFQSRFSEARSIAEEVVLEARRRNDHWAEGMITVVLSAIDLWEGHTISAERRAARATELLEGLGDTVALELALAVSARAAALLGHALKAVEFADSAIANSTLGDDEVSPAQITAAMVKLSLGSWAGYADECDRLNESVQHAAGLTEGTDADAHAVLVLAYAQAGDTARTREQVAVAAELAETRGVLAGALALGYASLGAFDDARAVLGQVLELPEGSYLDVVFAQLSVALEGADDSADLLAAIDETLSRTDDVLTPAIVGLAINTLIDAGHLGPVGATLARRDVEPFWRGVGVDPIGWRRLFASAVAR